MTTGNLCPIYSHHGTTINPDPANLLSTPLTAAHMEIENYNTGSIRPETAQQILKKNGMEVSFEEAKNILDFMFFLTNLSVDQIVDQDKNHGL